MGSAHTPRAAPKGCGSGPATISTNREERTWGQKASGSAFLSHLLKRKGNLELLLRVLFPPHKRKRQLFVCVQSFPAIPAESLHFKAHCRDIPPLIHALKRLWRPSSKPCFLCSPERVPSQHQEPPPSPQNLPQEAGGSRPVRPWGLPKPGARPTGEQNPPKAPFLASRCNHETKCAYKLVFQ